MPDKPSDLVQAILDMPILKTLARKLCMDTGFPSESNR